MQKRGGKLSDQKEIESEVDDFDGALKMMEVIGLKFNRYQENLRETWEHDGAEVVIDSWPGLKPYIEVEAKTEDKVRSIAEKLGFNWEDKIITAVVEVYMKVYNIGLKSTLDKTSHLTFENNPFKGLRANHNI